MISLFCLCGCYRRDYFLFCTSFFGLGIIMLRLRTAELPGNSYFPRRTIWLVCWWQRVRVGTLTKEKAYFTSSNCVFHSTRNSRQETKGLFKKQFQANYDLKSALKERWWKATMLFLWVFLLPFFPFFFFKENTRMKPTFFQEESILIQFHVFQLFPLSDLWAAKRTPPVTSVRWCVPYLKSACFGSSVISVA